MRPGPPKAIFFSFVPQTLRTRKRAHDQNNPKEKYPYEIQCYTPFSTQNSQIVQVNRTVNFRKRFVSVPINCTNNVDKLMDTIWTIGCSRD